MSELVDQVGIGKRFFLIAGNCVVEDEATSLETARYLKKLCGEYQLPLVYKSSFRKANRLSGESFSSIGDQAALDILAKIKRDLELPLLTDIHETSDIPLIGDIDILQIPAFLCRQTLLIQAAAATGKWVNIKKGQFMAPENMKEAATKAAVLNRKRVMLTERGTSFGYNNLIVDFRSLVIMKQFGFPVVFDATHSVQRPGGLGNSTGGDREYIIPLAQAAAAVGIDGLFVETHPACANALCDSATMLPLDRLGELVESVVAVDRVVKSSR